jgi:uncharacterized protein YcbX
MLVDGEGRFLTQRELPRLALLRPFLRPPDLVLTGPGVPDLAVSLDPANGPSRSVAVWRDRCDAWGSSEAADRWCSAFLEVSCQLVYLPSSSARPVDPQFAPSGGRVSFADAFPFLVIGSASLEDLNRRLAEPLPMNRFRPNLVVDGSLPFAEDRWRIIRVGSLELELVKPCERCVVTTTDQRTGHRGPEPLRTLATFRRGKSGGVLFGQNAIHREPGRLTVGDPIEVLAEAP